jgi:CheY-like chemotaxis protein
MMIRSSNDKPVAEPGSHTIMVVEPDILARMVIADYLRDCGYRVIEGVTAEDVLTVLRSRGVIDVIFSEVTLPGELDGFALAQRIRQMRFDIDVILTRGTASAAAKAGDLCDEGPLDKPYHPQEVIRRIKILRERRRRAKAS